MQTDPEIARAWQQLGDPKPTDLVDARLQAHWAVQIVSTAGRTHLETRADDSHTNLGWVDAHGALAGRQVGAHRAALRLADLTLLLLDEGDLVVAEQALGGKTLDQGYAWLQQALEQQAGKSGELQRPDYEMPEHAVSGGEPFSADAEALAELSRWFHNADLLLQKLAGWESNATEVRCWPHHFDLATLILEDPIVEVGADEASARSIGVGMEPGDHNYAEPYWYCTPWPEPRYLERPMLHGEGFWHFENDWFGAVLTGTRLVTAAPEDAQARRAEMFVRSAVAGSRLLLEAKFAKL